MKPEPAVSSPEILSATQPTPAAPPEPTTAVDPLLLDHPIFQQLVNEYDLAKGCLEAQKFVLDRLSGIFHEFGVASAATNPEEGRKSLRVRLGDRKPCHPWFLGGQHDC